MSLTPARIVTGIPVSGQVVGPEKDEYVGWPIIELAACSQNRVIDTTKLRDRLCHPRSSVAVPVDHADRDDE